MTDDEMDARLRAAGAAWRAAEDAPVATTRAEPAPLAAPTNPPRTRRHRLTLLATAAVVAAALAIGGVFALRGTGDGNRGADQGAPIDGTVWRLVGYDGQHEQPNSTATLYVGRDGRLVADDSCSLITGKADTGGGRLTITALDVRSYSCTDTVGQASFDRGLDTLRGRPTWSATRSTLTITGAGHTMHLAAAPELLPPTADRPTLTGATWKLTKIVDARGAEVPLRGTATLRIDGDSFRGSDTCNSMSGRATLTGNRLTLTSLATTEMACPDAVDSAAVVSGVFTGTAELTVTGATLTVTHAGAGTLTYAWQPDDEQATDPNRVTVTGWTLRSIAGRRASTPATLTITSAGALRLKTTCGGFTGQARPGAGTLTTSGLPQEAPKACADEITTVLSFLTSAPTLWSIQDGRLLIYGGSEQGFSAVFDPVNPVTAATVQLTGTWTLQSVTIEDGNSASGSGSSDTGITLTLTDSTYRSRTPCGEQAGPVTLGDRTIEFPKPLLGSCRRGALAGVHDVFDGTVSWSISGGQLTLKKGNVTLTFVR